MSKNVESFLRFTLSYYFGFCNERVYVKWISRKFGKRANGPSRYLNKKRQERRNALPAWIKLLFLKNVMDILQSEACLHFFVGTVCVNVFQNSADLFLEAWDFA